MTAWPRAFTEAMGVTRSRRQASTAARIPPDCDGRVAGAAQQFGDALALGLGTRRLGRLAGGGLHGARVGNRIALAENLHGEVPHHVERIGEAH